MSSWSIVLFTNLKPSTSIDALHIRMTMSVKLMYNYDYTVSYIYISYKKVSIRRLTLWRNLKSLRMKFHDAVACVGNALLSEYIALFWYCFEAPDLLLFLPREISHVTRRMQIKRRRVPKHIEKNWENDWRNSPLTGLKKKYISIIHICVKYSGG